MAEELAHLRAEIERARRILLKAEIRLLRLERRLRAKGEDLERLKEELRKEYPGMEFSEDSLNVLRLVGTLPPSPSDREELMEAIAEKYGD